MSKVPKAKSVEEILENMVSLQEAIIVTLISKGVVAGDELDSAFIVARARRDQLNAQYRDSQSEGERLLRGIMDSTGDLC